MRYFFSTRLLSREVYTDAIIEVAMMPAVTVSATPMSILQTSSKRILLPIKTSTNAKPYARR